MDKNLYELARQNWGYAHPVTRAMVFIDYKLERLIKWSQLESKEIFKRKNLRLFYWAPRIVGIGFIVGLSFFALDPFTNYESFALMVNYSVARLFPSLLLSLMLLLAWKKELVGGAIFLLVFLCLFIVIISQNPLPSDIIFYGPLFIIGSLFLIDSYIRKISV